MSDGVWVRCKEFDELVDSLACEIGRKTSSEMERCTTFRREGSGCTISCNLGLWSVSGKHGSALIGEAYHYFEIYKSDGEYSEILGGESVIEKLAKQRG